MSFTKTNRFRLRLTLDMAETLVEYFEHFAGDGVVTLEVNPAGIWFIEPYSDRVRFLGQADYSEEQLARLRGLRH